MLFLTIYSLTESLKKREDFKEESGDFSLQIEISGEDIPVSKKSVEFLGKKKYNHMQKEIRIQGNGNGKKKLNQINKILSSVSSNKRVKE